MKTRVRVVGIVAPIKDLHGVTTSSVGKGGDKRWFVKWDDNTERVGCAARSLAIEEGGQGSGAARRDRVAQNDGDDPGEGKEDDSESGTGSSDDR